MAVWRDSTGKDHVIRITLPKAIELKEARGIDLAACLVDKKAVEVVLQQLQDPAMLMSCCATLEGISDDQFDAYGSVWDGEAFENSAKALLDAIADFFQPAPRQVFKAILKKATAAAQRNQESNLKAAMAAVEKMDFSSVLSE